MSTNISKESRYRSAAFKVNRMGITTLNNLRVNPLGLHQLDNVVSHGLRLNSKLEMKIATWIGDKPAP